MIRGKIGRELVLDPLKVHLSANLVMAKVRWFGDALCRIVENSSHAHGLVPLYVAMECPSPWIVSLETKHSEATPPAFDRFVVLTGSNQKHRVAAVHFATASWRRERTIELTTPLAYDPYVVAVDVPWMSFADPVATRIVLQHHLVDLARFQHVLPMLFFNVFFAWGVIVQRMQDWSERWRCVTRAAAHRSFLPGPAVQKFSGRSVPCPILPIPGLLDGM